MVSDVYSIASGCVLHISVPSHITIVTADTYPASHWIVTVDPDNLLVVGPNAPFMGVSQHRTATCTRGSQCSACAV